MSVDVDEDVDVDVFVGVDVDTDVGRPVGRYLPQADYLRSRVRLYFLCIYPCAL